MIAHFNISPPYSLSTSHSLTPSRPQPQDLTFNLVVSQLCMAGSYGNAGTCNTWPCSVMLRKQIVSVGMCVLPFHHPSVSPVASTLRHIQHANVRRPYRETLFTRRGGLLIALWPSTRGPTSGDVVPWPRNSRSQACWKSHRNKPRRVPMPLSGKGRTRHSRPHICCRGAGCDGEVRKESDLLRSLSRAAGLKLARNASKCGLANPKKS